VGHPAIAFLIGFLVSSEGLRSEPNAPSGAIGAAAPQPLENEERAQSRRRLAGLYSEYATNTDCNDHGMDYITSRANAKQLQLL
jgi:hypothetical protein